MCAAQRSRSCKCRLGAGLMGIDSVAMHPPSSKPGQTEEAVSQQHKRSRPGSRDWGIDGHSPCADWRSYASWRAIVFKRVGTVVRLMRRKAYCGTFDVLNPGVGWKANTIQTIFVRTASSICRTSHVSRSRVTLAPHKETNDSLISIGRSRLAVFPFGLKERGAAKSATVNPRSSEIANFTDGKEFAAFAPIVPAVGAMPNESGTSEQSTALEHVFRPSCLLACSNALWPSHLWPCNFNGL